MQVAQYPFVTVNNTFSRHKEVNRKLCASEATRSEIATIRQEGRQAPIQRGKRYDEPRGTVNSASSRMNGSEGRWVLVQELFLTESSRRNGEVLEVGGSKR